MRIRDLRRPLAIAMWDFSRLERRWPGAGYENWDTALDELVERGYDAVRIDAYPHLVATDPHADWELLPVWNQQMWGSPARTVVRVRPALSEFVAACAERGVAVALSSWFRRDTKDTRMRVRSPEDLGRMWARVLDGLSADGLLDAILYVDLCNEFPGRYWAPFYRPDIGDDERVPGTPRTASTGWPARSRRCAPPTRGSTTATRSSPASTAMPTSPPSTCSTCTCSWQTLPLVTTECWGVVNYKDWPLLDWGWVKELNEYGVSGAVATGRWSAMATSTFCGPQFVGMWRDVAWHRRLTDLIRAGSVGT